jgi:hypothetical protein
VQGRRELGRERGRWLVLLSLILAVAASGFALLGPTGSEEAAQEAVPEGARPVEPVETRSTTLLGEIRAGEEDAVVLVWLVVPVAIAVAPLMLVRTRVDLAARIVAAALLLAFSFVAGASVGLFYLPSALAMVAAAIVGRAGQPQTG